jgi:hypothetical protein
MRSVTTRLAASLYAVVKSVCAWSASSSAWCISPFTIPGGNLVTDAFGYVPRSPLMTAKPVSVLVTPWPASTAKLSGRTEIDRQFGGVRDERLRDEHTDRKHGRNDRDGSPVRRRGSEVPLGEHAALLPS